MSTRIYVGNLSYSATEEKVRETFSAFGEVASVRMINDRETGRFRGFAFVEMSTTEAKDAAIKGLDGQEVDGRQLRVNEAQERPQGGGRGGFHAGPKPRYEESRDSYN
ncbi:MAG: RNA-binding protein [Spirochaetales bacterium]|jgi:RNA recognition motif-containing protein|nr:RNA-binding protein [Spirochaetales bacterium]